MPFSSLSDPADLARACAALEAIWNEVKASIPEHEQQGERTKIAYIVAACVPMAWDEDDLRANVLQQYRRQAFFD